MPTNTVNNQEWTLLVLFHAAEHEQPKLLWGEPLDSAIDVGLALSNQSQEVKVRVWDMDNPDDVDRQATGDILTVTALFCPLNTMGTEGLMKSTTGQDVGDDVGVIRGRKGPKLRRPTTRPVVLPNISKCPNIATFVPAIEDNEEMHLDIHFTILLRAFGDTEPLTAADPSQYAVGYTLGVSTRIRKVGDTSDPGPQYDGIDAYCPMGPALISPSQLQDPSDLSVKVKINGVKSEIKAQGARLKTIKSLARNTGNAKVGGYCMMGFPAGLLRNEEPRIKLKKGDEICFTASHGIGTLINSIHQERVPAALVPK